MNQKEISMHFTDIFIRRPVLSIVISLLILVLGLRSIGLLKVREFPFTQNAVVTVTTVAAEVTDDPQVSLMIARNCVPLLLMARAGVV
jgi:hypothetical protein